MLRNISALWAITLFYFAVGISAHMSMQDPPPINHPKNSFATNANFDYNNPLSPGGSDFPCKGQHLNLDSPAGQPVAEWQAGQSYSLTVGGGAYHMGGSCQASLSFDGGKTFKVIHSWIGNCPSANGETSYNFALPSDTPSADKALFAWSWFNKIGNREMYMNCAVVSISGGSGSLSNRPDMFAANIGNGCSTIETQDLEIPNPGADVNVQSSNTAPPAGSCNFGPGLTGPGNQGGGAGDGEHRSGQSSTPADSTPTDTPIPPVTTPRIGPPPVEGQPPFQPEPPVEGQPRTPDQPTQEECRCSAEANYVPGNDWPDWFNGAERLHPRVLQVILVQLGLFRLVPLVARYLAA
ncbi:hypothetical protein F5X68DRAFT_58647 [Plectosphaerella plurivora]|uniref:Lytic polysaccharide monooxygenase n=1 Tax=Plectosphaerella plurivora TaxID=936078 RepID=A0A9P9AFX2_9PEZI|nr:hypothetical protein F5X68DRAFT_58647 [Plectosphaerella plurivora]